MGRQPCCDKLGVKKGPWTAEEDKKLINFILTNGQCCWRAVPKLAGLRRCGKSCRLRWTNYLRPDLKRGLLTEAEEQLVIDLHSRLGNRSTPSILIYAFCCFPEPVDEVSSGFLCNFVFLVFGTIFFFLMSFKILILVFLVGLDTRLFSTFPFVGQSLRWKNIIHFGDNVYLTWKLVVDGNN